MLGNLFNMASAVRCTQTADAVQIYLPDTLDGPLSWTFPKGDNQAGIDCKITGPAPGQRNILVVIQGKREMEAPMSSEVASRAAVANIVRGLARAKVHRPGRRALHLLVASAVGGLLVFALVWGIGARAIGQARKSPDIVAQNGTTTPSRVPAATDQTVDAEGLGVLKKIRATNGIALGPLTDKTHVLYVFSDPNCPHCRNAAAVLDKLGPDVVPVIFPVAFFPGSPVAAAAAMCSKDTVKAWRAVTSGQAPADANQCAAGKAAVDLNTQMFSGVGFRYTPTFVADNGKIAVGETTVDDLRALFK
jgi:hypothetical protein